MDVRAQGQVFIPNENGGWQHIGYISGDGWVLPGDGNAVPLTEWQLISKFSTTYEISWDYTIPEGQHESYMRILFGYPDRLQVAVARAAKRYERMSS